VLLKIEVGVAYARNEAPKVPSIEAPKAPRGIGFLGRGLGSVVSSPSGVRGGAPAANAF